MEYFSGGLKPPISRTSSLAFYRNRSLELFCFFYFQTQLNSWLGVEGANLGDVELSSSEGFDQQQEQQEQPWWRKMPSKHKWFWYVRQQAFLKDLASSKVSCGILWCWLWCSHFRYFPCWICMVVGSDVCFICYVPIFAPCRVSLDIYLLVVHHISLTEECLFSRRG